MKLALVIVLLAAGVARASSVRGTVLATRAHWAGDAIVTGLANRGNRAATSVRSIAPTPRNSVARFCAIRRSVLIGLTALGRVLS